MRNSISTFVAKGMGVAVNFLLPENERKEPQLPVVPAAREQIPAKWKMKRAKVKLMAHELATAMKIWAHSGRGLSKPSGWWNLVWVGKEWYAVDYGYGRRVFIGYSWDTNYKSFTFTLFRWTCWLMKRKDGRNIISPLQTAFVSGKNIKENTLITHELFHHLKKKTRRQGSMAIKFNMEKTFNFVEWNFLFKIMEVLRYSATWINFIKECITTTSFSIIINCSMRGFFHSQRGLLRQGDLILPFLFTLCIGVLSRLISKSEE